MPTEKKDDQIAAAAEQEIHTRSQRFASVSMEIKPVSIAQATMDELTRIRHEMTAIRRLLATFVASNVTPRR